MKNSSLLSVRPCFIGRILPLFVLALLLMLFSCQKVDLTEYLGGSDDEEGYDVTFSVNDYAISDFEEVAATRSVSKKSASELGTVINCAIFSNGEKVKGINQKSSDDGFGTISVSLPEGDYQVVILLHSCSGNATLTTPEKITFPSNKVTDTFLCYKEITVSKSQSYDISLERVVGKYRMTLEDAIPDDVAQMKFYYTGGSSTLNAVTGAGCVSSRQTEILDVKSHATGQRFEVYTFPREDSDELTMTVTALDSNGESYLEKKFEGVPIAIRKITTHTCSFFGNSSSSQSTSFTLYGNDEWDGELEY